jgi:hypothetical protein
VIREKPASRRDEAIGWVAFIVFVVAVFRIRRALDHR